MIRRLSPASREISILEDAMKRLLKKFEDIMVAVTFAEAGEYDEARKIAGEAMDETLENIAEEATETA
jgi:hypothetical protein